VHGTTCRTKETITTTYTELDPSCMKTGRGKARWVCGDSVMKLANSKNYFLFFLFFFEVYTPFSLKGEPVVMRRIVITELYARERRYNVMDG